MNIKVDLFNPNSIDSAIRRIDKTRNAMDKLAFEATERLAKMGCQVVKENFSLLDSDETKTYEVNFRRTQDGYAIYAIGENVIFLEFGTGDFVTDLEYPEAEGLPNLAGGSWSITEGKGVYARHGFWHYRRKLFKGTYATRGFYYANDTIKLEAERVVKEVFAKMPKG